MWVVQDVVRRLRRDVGTFGFMEWRECLTALGIEWYFVEIPHDQCAFITEDIIFIDSRLTPFEQAYWVWHEIGHQYLHAACALWWKSRPQGRITVDRFEHQANTFVLLYPRWPQVFSFDHQLA